MSKFSPAADRARRIMSTPSARSPGVIVCPPERIAASSKGQIFMAVKPISFKLATNFSGSLRNATKSSYESASGEPICAFRFLSIFDDPFAYPDPAQVLYARILSRTLPPNSWCKLLPVSWPNKSHSAKSMADAARTATPDPAKPIKSWCKIS